MMNVRMFAIPVLAAFLIVALFGMYLFLFGMDHEMGCPFMPDDSALCATSILEHLAHWQNAFAAVVAQALLLLAVAFLLYIHFERLKLSDRYAVRLRTYLSSKRPTLFQELFSGGTLNPKAP